jgi:transcriptional regulator with XRE-family HTH domain
MSIDERIGQNLAITRGDMSQKDLADRMRARGFKWSQATVWAIERGERPLRLAEAEEVAHLLSRPLEVLLAQDGEATVHAATRAVNEKYDAIFKAFEAYDDARGELAMSLDQIPDSEKRGLLYAATDWVTTTLDDVVRAYRDEQRQEFAAMLARYDITQEHYDIASRRDQWLDRFNKAQQAFRERKTTDGVDQTEG